MATAVVAAQSTQVSAVAEVARLPAQEQTDAIKASVPLQSVVLLVWPNIFAQMYG